MLATRHDYGGLFSPHIEQRSIDASDLAGAWAEGVSRHFGWPLIALAVLGAMVLIRRDRVAGLALTAVVVVAGPLFAIANRMPIGDEHGLAFAERFSTMSEVPMGVLLALGQKWTMS